MIDALSNQPYWMLGAILLVAFFESFALIGILLPGVVMLFTLAALAGNIDLNLPSVLLAAALGASAGDISSYFIGRWIQPRIMHWRWLERHQAVFEQGHWFFVRWGWLSVALGRFIGPIRPIIPLVAGTLDMPVRRFIGVSLVSVMLWAPAYILPGYLTGEAFELLEQRSLSEQVLAAIALSGGFILVAGLTIYHHTHPEHPRTARLVPFIRSFPPDFPFASIGLAAISIIVLIWLTVASPLALDALLSGGIVGWQDNAFTPWVAAVRQLSDPTLIALITVSTALWLWLRGHRVASLHWLLLPSLFSLLLIFTRVEWLQSLFPGTTRPDSASLRAIAETALFAFCLSLLSAFFNEDRSVSRRWQLYLPAGALIVIMALTGLWLGLYRPSDAMANICLALLVSAMTRISYTTLSPKRLKLEHSAGFIALLAIVILSFLELTIDLPVH